jgi:hypothetical protein
VKIGPTALPISGREKYSITEGWSISDFRQAVKAASSMLSSNPRQLSGLIKDEWPNILESNLVA